MSKYTRIRYFGCSVVHVVNHHVAESRKPRKCVHPIINYRDERGDISNLVAELGMSHRLYKRYFRMTMQQFDDVFALICPEIWLQNTRWRNNFDPEQQLYSHLSSVRIMIYEKNGPRCY
jgi:hypothetical protein